MTAEQAQLAQRLRILLAGEPSMREVSMFGGLAFMVNNTMLVSAGRTGDLLVRVDPERDAELRALPGAARAEMGAGRSMGVGWITAAADSIASDAQLAFWLDAVRREARS